MDTKASFYKHLDKINKLKPRGRLAKRDCSKSANALVSHWLTTSGSPGTDNDEESSFDETEMGSSKNNSDRRGQAPRQSTDNPKSATSMNRKNTASASMHPAAQAQPLCQVGLRRRRVSSDERPLSKASTLVNHDETSLFVAHPYNVLSGDRGGRKRAGKKGHSSSDPIVLSDSKILSSRDNMEPMQQLTQSQRNAHPGVDNSVADKLSTMSSSPPRGPLRSALASVPAAPGSPEDDLDVSPRRHLETPKMQVPAMDSNWRTVSPVKVSPCCSDATTVIPSDYDELVSNTKTNSSHGNPVSPTPVRHCNRRSLQAVLQGEPPLLSRAETAPTTSTRRRSTAAPERSLRRSRTMGETSALGQVDEASYKQAKPAPKKGKGKAKPSKDDIIVMKPERQQIFRGMTAFMLPNDTTLLQRKLRMKACIERGGIRATEFSSGVTHLILDGEHWTYRAALECLPGNAIGGGVKVVNGDYIPDCAHYNILLDPLGQKYRVKGHQEALDEQARKDEAALRNAKANRTDTTAGMIDDSSASISTKDYEVPDSQLSDRGPATPRGTGRPMAPPSPQSAASLQIKAGKRKRHETPGTPGMTSPSPMRDFILVKKQAKVLTVVSSEPPRRKKATPPADFGHPFSVEVTPSAATPSSTHLSQISPRSRDALDDAIDVSRDLADLPVDLDEDSQLEESQGDREYRRAKKARSFALSPGSRQKTFQCMHKHDGSANEEGPNAGTIAILTEMADHYALVKDNFRATSYRKAIAALKHEVVKVTSAEQATKIPGIGTRLAAKIEEIVKTNSLKRLEAAHQDPTDTALRLFTQVYGAGLAQAQAWVARGFRTLDHLRTKAELSKNQQIGLDHYDDFLERIPRNEVEAHGDFVKKVLAEVSPKLEATVGGSFRRGALSSGDVDFLITSNDERTSDHVLRTLLFEDLIPRLEKLGYLKASLATHSSEGGSKWHGAACLPDSRRPTWRRVDFLMVPPREWGAALIYFTGNDIFNRSLRLLASKKGMRLNQHGLYKDVIRGPGRAKITEGTLLEGRDEKKIFEILGVPYRPPEHRIV